MKEYIYGFWMCQSMFCAIPCPVNIWKEESRGKMLLFLPVIGLEIGFLWWLLAWISQALTLPQLLRGLLLCICPFWLTGFIHLDGYMDVLDAVKSCRSLERRREILKDSHVGAFAVIGVVILMLAQFAFCACLQRGSCCLIFAPVVSRCCSVLAILLLKPMSTSQYSSRQGSKAEVAFVILLLLAAFLLGYILSGVYAAALAAEVITYVLALRRGYRSLEGMNGDISGYALTISELAAVAGLVLIQEVL